MIQTQRYEAKFTSDDVKKIRSKRSKSNAAFLLAFAVVSVLAYALIGSAPLYVMILLGIVFIILCMPVFDMLFGDNSCKDLRDKIKVVTKVKVSNKRTDSEDNTYTFEFEGNDDIKYYHVKRIHYEKINIGDIIDIEYSKKSHWILKIEFNSLSIENNNYIK
jgi:hypothetical protein